FGTSGNTKCYLHSKTSKRRNKLSLKHYRVCYYLVHAILNNNLFYFQLKITIPPLAPQHPKQHVSQQSFIPYIAPIISATPAVAILNPVNITKIPITNPHDNPFENFATICKPIAVKMMFQILKISMDANNTPNAPSASTIEFKLVK